MDYDVPFVHGDVVICGCEVKCFVEKVLADGWINSSMSKQIKLRCCLFFYGFEPLDCGGSDP